MRRSRWCRPSRIVASRLLLGLLLVAPCKALGAGQKEEPPDPNVCNAEGARANSVKDYQSAVAAFRKAYEIEADPLIKHNLQVALKNLSVDLAEKGQAQAAIEACSEAQRLFPDDVTVAAPLAIYFNNKAVEFLDELRIGDEIEAAKFAENNEKAFRAALGAAEIAEEVVERFRLAHLAPRIAETHGFVYLLEARYYFIRNEWNVALEKLEKCLSVNPNEPRAYLDRSWIHYVRKYYDDAVADLEEAAHFLATDNPQAKAQVEGLIVRITAEAEAGGHVLTGPQDFFDVEAVEGSPEQERTVRRLLRDTRREMAEALSVNPNRRMVVTVDWTKPLVRVGEWLIQTPQEPKSGDFTIGANGVDLEGQDFQRALRLLYVLALVSNVGEGRAPYWFVSGLAQIMADGGQGLSREESETLLLGSENALLLGASRLVWENLAGLENAQVLRLANLESKALVSHLVGVIRTNGLGKLMELLRGGADFESALWEVARMTPTEAEEEWRRALGIPVN